MRTSPTQTPDWMPTSHEDARALDSMSLSAETVACALGAVRVLEYAGWQAVHERARGLAGRLVQLLGERGRTVVARGDSTLVSFEPRPRARARSVARVRGDRA